MNLDFKQIGLIALVAALALLVQKWGKSMGKGTRSARLMKKYAVITEELFDGIPQDELVEAMVCRVLADCKVAVIGDGRVLPAANQFSESATQKSGSL